MRVLGHDFRAMTDYERYGFGGASKESVICYLDSDKYILIYDPTDQTMTEIDCEDDMRETVWTRTFREAW